MKLRPIILAGATFAFALCGGHTHGHAESVFVKYRGEVDLKPFECTDIARSSFIDRVCYDRRNEYMLISLNGTFYHYCEIDAGTVSSLLTAPSMGGFYNATIKGAFDCRIHHMPGYSAAPVQDPCAASLLGFCVSHYTQEEEAEREKLAALEAELEVRKHVHYGNGMVSIYEGIFTTTFLANATDLSITCGYDSGMEVVFSNENKSASVRIGMDEIVCDGIAKNLGTTVSRWISGGE